jgi:F0F1-type ATP synthase assembly protein I
MEPNDKKESIWKSPYMKVFIKVSGWIVVPVLIGSFIGNTLDDKFGTAPWILAITLLCSFIISMIFIVKTAKRYQKDFDKTNKDGNK